MATQETASTSIKSSEKLSYITARVGFSLILTLYGGGYQSLFLNTVCGMSMASIASALALAKLLNVIEVLMIQPMLFEWASKGRWGRFRTWFVVSPILCLLSHLMLESYITVITPDKLKPAFVVFGYVMVNSTLNIQSSSLNSLSALWIKDPVDRYKTQAQMQLTSNLATTGFGFAMLPLMYAIGGANVINARGMTFLVVLYNVINIVACIPVFKFTGNLDLDRSSGNTRTNALSSLSLIFKNRNVAGMMFANAFALAGGGSWNQVFTFMFLYYYKNGSVLSIYNGMSKAIIVCAHLITIAIAKRANPRMAYKISYTMSIVNYILIYFFCNDAISAMVFVCLQQLFVGLTQSAGTPMYAEVVDYTKWKTGENITTSIFTVQQSAPMLSGYISNNILTGLAMIGFSAGNPETHVPEVLSKMKMLSCFMPSALYGLALLVFLFVFNITPEMAATARKELAERDAAEKAAANA
ncbi:MAG: MFS transporter [Eubacteriaceae bacterium]|nr:MFS transporter [Eubacteriaceae bacterium]